jgi:hypothetical protein
VPSNLGLKLGFNLAVNNEGNEKAADKRDHHSNENLIYLE